MVFDAEFDVAVVGGGPGGSVAAMKCAEKGLRTVLIEKHSLPRNKVCTGMIMSEMAQALVEQEFGLLTEDALTVPPYVMGIKFLAQGVETLTFKHRMPFAWRKDLDYWMNKAAQRKGAELLEKAKVKRIRESKEMYILEMEGGAESQSIRARYLIGADGTVSVVRKALFPAIRMQYQLCIRQCYQGSLDLDPEYVHFFYLPDITAFGVNFKGDVFLLELAPRPFQGDGSGIVQQAETWLARSFGFTQGLRPLWRDACIEPAMGRRRFSAPLPMTKNNALLIGNAAGLPKPITGEGIGTAIKSGLMAAECIIQASNRGEKAEKFYLPMAQGMVSDMDRLYPPHGKIAEACRRGIDCFLTTFVEIYSSITGTL